MKKEFLKTLVLFGLATVVGITVFFVTGNTSFDIRNRAFQKDTPNTEIQYFWESEDEAGYNPEKTVLDISEIETPESELEVYAQPDNNSQILFRLKALDDIKLEGIEESQTFCEITKAETGEKGWLECVYIENLPIEQ